MANPFRNHVTLLDDPARNGFNITPDNDNDLPQVTRFIWVGSTGNLSVILENDSTAVSFNAIPAGTLLKICAKRVNFTGTSAGNLVGLY